MRILQLVHGYPPRETAGTEQHTQRLVDALMARGHHLHVLAATRSPGQPQYKVSTDGHVTRVVNNIPARPLAAAESDSSIDRVIERVARDFRPDIVHVQHTQFLSSTMKVAVPTVATLHDAWAFCPAGGTLLDLNDAICSGPQPDKCSPCAAAWAPVPGRRAQFLTQLAGTVSGLVAPDKLATLYRKVPDSWRAPIRRRQAESEAPAAALRRNDYMRSLYQSFDARIAPSQFLADAAMAAGLGETAVIRHGASTPRPRVGGGDVLFLGTISWHKGPDIVVKAWRAACPSGAPALRVHGVSMQPELLQGHPLEARLSRDEVFRALASARVLVVGSRWPENAPMVIVEALAAGCPVIAPAIGGVPELIVDGDNGRLYPVGDIEALAQCLREVIAEPLTVSASRSLDDQVSETEDLYRRICGASA